MARCFRQAPAPDRSPESIAGEATHEGISFCADGVCREAQVSCHLAGTAELSRPCGHDAELRGRAGRVCPRRGDGFRLDQLLGTPLLGQQADAKPGGHGGRRLATVQEGADRPVRATAAASQSRPGCRGDWDAGQPHRWPGDHGVPAGHPQRGPALRDEPGRRPRQALRGHGPAAEGADRAPALFLGRALLPVPHRVGLPAAGAAAAAAGDRGDQK